MGANILPAVASLGKGTPICLVVASNAYAELLDNWLLHMDALDICRIVVVTMDEALSQRLQGTELTVVQATFDGSEGDFWLQRAKIWLLLADAGVEFIHSDIDAVWLRDPIPDYTGDDFDILVSQGTLHPEDILAVWGFVVCTGFFWARPTPQMRILLRALVTPSNNILNSDDQAYLNRWLAEIGIEWQTDAKDSYNLICGDKIFRAYRDPIAGVCKSIDLKITLLPHHLFPRLQPGAADAIVRHVLRTGDPSQRLERMREAGCWQLDKYQTGFMIPK
jgi:hypothetical protein